MIQHEAGGEGAMSLFGLDQQIILIIAAAVGVGALLLLIIRVIVRRSRLSQTQRTRAMHRVPHGIATDPRPDPPWYTGPPTLLPPHATPPGKVVVLSDHDRTHGDQMFPSHLTETQSNLPLDYSATRYEDLFPPNDSDDTAASVGRDHVQQP
jgi:hypothetical protein